MSVEDARQVTVLRNAAKPSELGAALKLYIDHDEHAVAILYEPDAITTYKLPVGRRCAPSARQMDSGSSALERP